MRMDKDFFDKVASLVEQSRGFVGRTVDLTMCITYYEIGRMIVEQEQDGQSRAEYGRGLIKELSAFLNGRFERGFSVANLRNARQFYLLYSPIVQQIPTGESAEPDDNRKYQALISVFESKNTIRQPAIGESYPFKVSWTHYLILMRIKNEDERRFYEIEAAEQQWSVRQYHANTTAACMSGLPCPAIKTR